MKHKTLTLLTALSCMYACQSSPKVEEHILATVPNEQMYMADLENNECKKQLDVSSIFSKVRYIPLETNKQSLLGRINQLYVKGDTIFILDATLAKSLHIFRKDGKHLGRIGRQGNGPGEYKNPTDFGLCDSLLYLFDAATQRISYYSLPDLQFKASYTIPSTASAISRYVAVSSGNLYADIYLPDRKCPYLIREISPKDASTSHWLSTDLHNKGYLSHTYFTGQSFFHKTAYGIRYNQQMMDTIMKIEDGKISPYLAMQYKNRPTYADIAKIDAEKGTETTLSRLGGVLNISDYTEWDNAIMFHFQKGAYRQVGMLDKRSGNFQWADKLNHDLTFLPDKPCPVNPLPVFGEGKRLYAYIHPMEMEQFLSMVSQNETRLSASEIEDLKKLPADSNPIILCYEE